MAWDKQGFCKPETPAPREPHPPPPSPSPLRSPRGAHRRGKGRGVVAARRAGDGGGLEGGRGNQRGSKRGRIRLDGERPGAGGTRFAGRFGGLDRLCARGGRGRERGRGRDSLLRGRNCSSRLRQTRGAWRSVARKGWGGQGGAEGGGGREQRGEKEGDQGTRHGNTKSGGRGGSSP